MHFNKRICIILVYSYFWIDLKFTKEVNKLWIISFNIGNQSLSLKQNFEINKQIKTIINTNLPQSITYFPKFKVRYFNNIRKFKVICNY